jgi:hypothetical protein
MQEKREGEQTRAGSKDLLASQTGVTASAVNKALAPLQQATPAPAGMAQRATPPQPQHHWNKIAICEKKNQNPSEAWYPSLGDETPPMREISCHRHQDLP